MYYPKNKIKTNLYTKGNELIYFNDRKNYIGKYWTTSNGKFFSGLGPTDKSYSELIKGEQGEAIWEQESSNPAIKFSQYTPNYDGLLPDGQTQNMLDNETYASLHGTNINLVQIIPTPFYPQPTESDYKLGEFQRYFCVKANELKYTEVTKEQYEKFKNKDESVAWQYYIAFSLPWDISGEKEQVYHTNKNIVLITEQNNKRRGLQEFLRKNYLKFYLVS